MTASSSVTSGAGPLDTAGPSLGVAVVESDLVTRTRLGLLLGSSQSPVSEYPTIEGLDEPTAPDGPLVVVLGPSMADTSGLEAAEHLARRRPEAGLVLVVDELSTSLLQRALRVGVKDVVANPDAVALVEAVARVGAGLSLPGAAAGSAGAGEPFGEAGRLVTVSSTKGGAGKSVVATNLAMALARRGGRPVALVDADLQFGDVAILLKLTPQHTIVDAVTNLDRLDLPLLQTLVSRHEPSGVIVLPAPSEPAFADQVSPAALARIIELLRSFCSFVIVDTPAYLNDIVLWLLDESDDIVLVTGMDIPNVKNTKIGLQTLRLLDVPPGKLRLVLNRVDAKVTLDVAEVERSLQLDAAALLPDDVCVGHSVNKGVPAVLGAPRSSFARGVEQLADLFAPVDAPERRRRR